MSKSLRDQLMKAGLVSKQKAKETKKELHKQAKAANNKSGKKTALKPYDLQEAPERRAERMKAVKKARDQALEVKRKANSLVREKNAQIRQLLKAHQVERQNGEEPFQFVLPAMGKTIKKIAVNADQHKQLCSGQLAVVLFQDQFFLVKPEGAEKIHEREPDIVYRSDPPARSSDRQSDDPYAGYEIPDDLMW